MRSRLRSLPLLFATVLLVACHKGGPSTETGRPARDPMAVVPLAELAEGELPAFALVDLDAVRSSGYLDSFLRRIRADFESDADPGKQVFLALLDRTSQLYFALSETPGGRDLDLEIVVARGQYSAEDMARLEQTMTGGATHSTQGPYALSCSADACFSLVGGHTLILGPQPAVARALDRQLHGGGGSLTRDAELSALLDATQAGTSDVVLGARAVPGVVQALASEVPAGLLETMQAGAATASVEGGLSLRARVRTTSGAAAADGAARVREPIDAARRNPMMMAFGLRDVLDAIVVEAQGNDTVASLSLPDARVRQLTSMLEGLLQVGGG